MKTRKKNNQKRIQQFFGIQKLKVNELFKIRGGDGTDRDKIIE